MISSNPNPYSSIVQHNLQTCTGICEQARVVVIAFRKLARKGFCRSYEANPCDYAAPTNPIANAHIGNWEFEDTVRFLG